MTKQINQQVAIQLAKTLANECVVVDAKNKSGNDYQGVIWAYQTGGSKVYTNMLQIGEDRCQVFLDLGCDHIEQRDDENAIFHAAKRWFKDKQGDTPAAGEFCTGCGTQNANDASFCKGCGNKLDSVPKTSNKPAATSTSANTNKAVTGDVNTVWKVVREYNERVAEIDTLASKFDNLSSDDEQALEDSRHNARKQMVYQLASEINIHKRTSKLETIVETLESEGFNASLEGEQIVLSATEADTKKADTIAKVEAENDSLRARLAQLQS